MPDALVHVFATKEGQQIPQLLFRIQAAEIRLRNANGKGRLRIRIRLPARRGLSILALASIPRAKESMGDAQSQGRQQAAKEQALQKHPLPQIRHSPPAALAL